MDEIPRIGKNLVHFFFRASSFKATRFGGTGQRAGQRRRKVSSLSGEELAEQFRRWAFLLWLCSTGLVSAFFHFCCLDKLDFAGGMLGNGSDSFENLQVPQRLYSLDELKLNGINPSSLLSPVDETLGSVERNLQLAAIAGGVSMWKAFSFSPQEIFYLSVGLLFLWTLDVVSFNGGFSSLVLDTIGHTLSQKYHNRVIQHEAGHFLIAYLLGVLPKGYTLSSLEAFQKEGSLNVQAGTSFVDFEFLEEINSGKVSATMVDRFSCIALAGVASEYLLYGLAEGGLADINKLDLLLKSLGFTQKKADSQVRWSVLNTIFLLRRHKLARSKLADAMSSGKSVGSCIAVIEDAVNIDDI